MHGLGRGHTDIVHPDRAAIEFHIDGVAVDHRDHRAGQFVRQLPRVDRQGCGRRTGGGPGDGPRRDHTTRAVTTKIRPRAPYALRRLTCAVSAARPQASPVPGRRAPGESRRSQRGSVVSIGCSSLGRRQPLLRTSLFGPFSAGPVVPRPPVHGAPPAATQLSLTSVRGHAAPVLRQPLDQGRGTLVHVTR